jgi:UDP-N-acetylmuramoylalanine--D-glutamate ligase
VNHLSNRNVLVMGLGLFGGGVGAVRFLCEAGADVTVTDLRGESDLQESINGLRGLPITYVLGRHEEKDFESASLVVANPGVPRSSKYLKIAEDVGIPITTEICLFVERCKSRIIGVTGSSGKTTTTALLTCMLEQESEKVFSGGNLGGSLLGELKNITADSRVVLELSSFQLDYLGELSWSPNVAVVTNFAPNHIDVHGSLEAYRNAKMEIVRHQAPNDVAILNADDPEVRAWGKARQFQFSIDRPVPGGTYEDAGSIWHNLSGVPIPICETAILKLRGTHNLHNALAAACAGLCEGVNELKISSVLASFEGVEHRLEFVAELDGVKFVNDSIATTPERTQVAIESLPGRIVLIAGGYNKGLVYDRLGIDIGKRVSDLVLLGETADTMAESVPQSGVTQIHRAESLENALAISRRCARKGDTVLFSPASASYDMFRNFADRGRLFKAIVKEMGVIGD